MIHWHEYSLTEDTQNELCARIIDILQEAIQLDGLASIALSGGSTPIPLYKALANASIEWSKVNFAMVDERWVDLDHPRSNESIIRKALANAIEKGAHFTGMKNGSKSPLSGLNELNESYNKIKRPFDCLLLGMGNDGHFASLFPNSLGLDEAFSPDNSSPCIAIEAKQTVVTGKETSRCSLTAIEITKAKNIFLLIKGEDKRKVLKQAEETNASPIGRLIRMASLHVYWSP